MKKLNKLGKLLSVTLDEFGASQDLLALWNAPGDSGQHAGSGGNSIGPGDSTVSAAAAPLELDTDASTDTSRTFDSSASTIGSACDAHLPALSPRAPVFSFSRWKPGEPPSVASSSEPSIQAHVPIPISSSSDCDTAPPPSPSDVAYHSMNTTSTTTDSHSGIPAALLFILVSFVLPAVGAILRDRGWKKIKAEATRTGRRDYQQPQHKHELGVPLPVPATPGTPGQLPEEHSHREQVHPYPPDDDDDDDDDDVQEEEEEEEDDPVRVLDDDQDLSSISMTSSLIALENGPHAVNQPDDDSGCWSLQKLTAEQAYKERKAQKELDISEESDAAVQANAVVSSDPESSSLAWLDQHQNCTEALHILQNQRHHHSAPVLWTLPLKPQDLFPLQKSLVAKAPKAIPVDVVKWDNSMNLDNDKFPYRLPTAVHLELVHAVLQRNEHRILQQQHQQLIVLAQRRPQPSLYIYPAAATSNIAPPTPANTSQVLELAQNKIHQHMLLNQRHSSFVGHLKQHNQLLQRQLHLQHPPDGKDDDDQDHHHEPQQPEQPSAQDLPPALQQQQGAGQLSQEEEQRQQQKAQVAELDTKPQHHEPISKDDNGEAHPSPLQEQLKSECAQLQDTVQSLLKQLEQTKDQHELETLNLVEQGRQQFDEQQAHFAQQAAELEQSLQQQHRVMTEELVQTKQPVADLQVQLEQSQVEFETQVINKEHAWASQREQLLQELEKLHQEGITEREELSTQMVHHEEQSQRTIQEQQQLLEQRSEQCTELQLERNDLQQKVLEIEQALETQRHQLSELVEEGKQVLQVRVNALQDELARVHDERDKLTQEVLDKNGVMQEKDQQVRRLTDQVQAVLQELQAKDESLAHDKDNMARKQAIRELQMEQLEHQLRAKEEQQSASLVELQTRLEQEQGKCASLARDLEVQWQLHQERQQEQCQLLQQGQEHEAQLVARIESLEQELREREYTLSQDREETRAHLEEQCQQLTCTVEDRSHDVALWKANAEEFQELSRIKDEQHQADTKELKQQIEDQKDHNDKLAECHKQEISKLEGEKEQLKDSLRRANFQCLKWQQEHSQLQDDLAGKQAEFEAIVLSWQQRLDELSDKHSNLVLASDETSRALALKEGECSILAGKLEPLSAQILSLETERSAHEQQLRNWEEELSASELKLKEGEEKISLLDHELANTSNRLEEANQELDTTSALLDAANNVLIARQQKIEELSQLQVSVDSLTASLLNRENDFADLHRKWSQNESRLTEKVQYLEHALCEKEDQLQAQHDSTTNAAKLQRELESCLARNQKLESCLDELKAATELRESRMKSRDREIADLKANQNGSGRDAHEIMIQTLLCQHQSEMEVLSKANHDLEQNLGSKSRMCDDLSDKIEALTNVLKISNQRDEHLEKNMRRVSVEVKTVAHAVCAADDGDNNKANTKIQELKAKRLGKEQKAKALIAALHEGNNDAVAPATSSPRVDESVVALLQSALAEKERECAKLLLEVEALEAELSVKSWARAKVQRTEIETVEHIKTPSSLSAYLDTSEVSEVESLSSISTTERSSENSIKMRHRRHMSDSAASDAAKGYSTMASGIIRQNKFSPALFLEVMKQDSKEPDEGK